MMKIAKIDISQKGTINIPERVTKNEAKKLLPLKLKKVNEEEERKHPTKRASIKKLRSTFGDVIASLKSHRDRKLEKELQNLDVRKKNREIEHFLAQRKFFLTKVFTANNQLRFSRLDSSTSEGRPKSQPPLDTGTSSPGSEEHNSRRTSRDFGRPRTSPEKTGLLRDLLFLEEDHESDSPNRKKILQAEKILLGRRHRKINRSTTASLQADIIRLYKEQPLVREVSSGRDNSEDTRETMVRFNENEEVIGPKNGPEVLPGSHCSSSDPEDDSDHPQATPDLGNLRTVSQVSGLVLTPRVVTLTLGPSNDKTRHKQSPTERPTMKPAVKCKDNLEKGRHADIERQERLIQRIMLTVPPKMIANATARAQNLSDMMGHRQKKASLLQMEKENGRNLGRGDLRFQNLVLALGR